jgi:S-formylglutathione hydrolase FrmB
VSETPVQPPPRSPHSRWSLALRVLGALAVVGLALLVDRVIFDEGPGHERFGARVRTLTLESDALDRDVPLKVVVPPRAPPKGRSLVVFLHGRGEDERSYLVDPMFEALSNLRGRAPVMAFPFGGDSSYWHNRDSGQWADYVLDEVIPRMIDRFDVDPGKIAIGGISMGGFGAYDIARLDPGAFCAIGGHSPAIWETAGETADGAFDDANDFAANDVIAIAGHDPSPYKGARLWLDAGESDPFLPGDDALEENLRRAGTPPIVSRSPGGHDSDYWNGNWREYLGFYASALRNCPARPEPSQSDDAKQERQRPADEVSGSRGPSNAGDRRGGP